MPGQDEPVWVEAAKVKMKGIRHDYEFPEEVRELFRVIKESVDEVHPQSLEEWEDGFCYDQHPEREIATWLHIAEVYRRHGKTVKSKRKKMVIFDIILR